MSLYEELRNALLDARDRFADMRKDEYGYEELRVAIIHLEELHETMLDEGLHLEEG